MALRESQGADCVEMECASWCAIAKFRNYKFAQLLYFSDALKQSGWTHNQSKAELKVLIIQLMINCVEEFVKSKNK